MNDEETLHGDNHANAVQALATTAGAVVRDVIVAAGQGMR